VRDSSTNFSKHHNMILEDQMHDEFLPSHKEPFPKGDRNANPLSIGLLALLAEDFRTHDRDFLDPGFWAVAIHRFGNARMGVRLKLFRAPLTVIYKLMFTAMDWFWGINLPYNTKLGRRVRIWHHGGIWHT